MIPLNRYFQTFGDDLALHNAIVGVDYFCCSGDLWRLVNLESNIERLKSDYKRAYRLAHESAFRVGFIFLHDRDAPIYSYVSICNPFDGKWVGFVIVRYDVTAERMESITMQAVSDCHLKMLRVSREQYLQ